MTKKQQGMNRPIKFRAVAEDGKIYQVTEISWRHRRAYLQSLTDPTHYIVVAGTTFDATKFLQFTGLLDKNGMKIFEGDIVHCWWPLEEEPSEDRYKIVWNEIMSGFEVDDPDDRTYSLAYGNMRYEVIGNIYESPELLK